MFGLTWEEVVVVCTAMFAMAGSFVALAWLLLRR